jgi:hypothetical protein
MSQKHFFYVGVGKIFANAFDSCATLSTDKKAIKAKNNLPKNYDDNPKVSMFSLLKRPFW